MIVLSLILIFCSIGLIAFGVLSIEDTYVNSGVVVGLFGIIILALILFLFILRHGLVIFREYRLKLKAQADENSAKDREFEARLKDQKYEAEYQASVKAREFNARPKELEDGSKAESREVEVKAIDIVQENHIASQFTCPHCKSEDIQRLSIAYSSGTFNINTKTGGVVVGATGGGIGVGIGGGVTTGTSRSLLSAAAKPPDMPENKGQALAAQAGCGTGCTTFIIAFIFICNATKNDSTPSDLGVLAFFASIVFGYIIGYIIYASTLPHYQDKVRSWEFENMEWKQKWLCKRCGFIFVNK